jgi:hypothetical protein
MQRRYLLGLPVLLAACQASEPEIGRALPSEYAAANQEFDRRVKLRYPEGTIENSVVEDLKRQGFVVKSHAGWKEANFTKNYFVIENVWSVRWKASDSRVQEITGLRFGRGL